MIYMVEEIRQRNEPIAVRYRLKAVYLFGSYAWGETTEDSDIDLLVALLQHPQMPSEQDFRQAIERERVNIYAVA